MRLRPARLPVLGLLTAASLAGCGATVAARHGHLIRLGVTEYRLRPASLSAAPGTDTFVITNFGRLTHDLAILRGAVTLKMSKPIPPGETLRMVVTLRPGAYTLESTITSDTALGMRGSLRVDAHP